MSPAARHRARLREDTIGRLREWLARNPPPRTERVILFGSLARGEFDGASDADLMIVGEGLLPSAILAAAGRDVDMLVWTPGEWRAALARDHPFARVIQEEGVELWCGQEDSNFHGVAPTSTSS